MQVNDTGGFNNTGTFDVQVYAQDPSSSSWYGPDGATWTVASVDTAVVPIATYAWKAIGMNRIFGDIHCDNNIITFLVACINTTGGDCFSQYCVTDPSALVAFGFCWQDLFVGSGLANTKPKMQIIPRPLTMYSPNDNQFAYFDGTSDFWPSAVTSSFGNVVSSEIVLALPLADANDNINAIGAPSNKMRRFYPGLENNGGTITVDLWKVVTKLSDGTTLDTPLSEFPIEWTSQLLSLEQPAVSFVVNPVPGSDHAERYDLFFRVSLESNPSVITPSNSSQNSSEGIYHSGAYVIPM